MIPITRQAREVGHCESGKIPDDLNSYSEPVVLRGLVNHWELVKKSLHSDITAAEYLKAFYNGRPTLTYFGEPGLNGRYGYNNNATQLNFKKEKAQIDEVIDLIIAHLDDSAPPSVYIASNIIDSNFPGLRQKNDLDMSFAKLAPNSEAPIPSIWIGNKSIARCHYDASDNIACAVKGRRRFIMFPPEQIENLYPGPLSPTPGGQVISMVNFHI